jgi:hypothetical protein
MKIEFQWHSILGDIMKDSKFRLWVQEIWMQNCEEHLSFNEKPYKIKEYWEQYKYWLKREYKYQKSLETLG